MKLTNKIADPEQAHELLSFVFLRNLLRLQNFCRAILKMKYDAACKI